MNNTDPRRTNVTDDLTQWPQTAVTLWTAQQPPSARAVVHSAHVVEPDPPHRVSWSEPSDPSNYGLATIREDMPPATQLATGLLAARDAKILALELKLGAAEAKAYKFEQMVAIHQGTIKDQADRIKCFKADLAQGWAGVHELGAKIERQRVVIDSKVILGSQTDPVASVSPGVTTVLPVCETGFGTPDTPTPEPVTEPTPKPWTGNARSLRSGVP